LNPKPHEAQLEDQKSSRRHLEEGKIVRPTKGTKSDKPSKIAKKSQEKLKITPPESNSL
jgi:hypothetical protein